MRCYGIILHPKEALDNTWNKKAEEIMYLLKKEENK